MRHCISIRGSVCWSVSPSIRRSVMPLLQMTHRVARLGLLQKINSRCYHHSLTSSPPELPWMRLEKWLQCLVTQTSSAIRLFTLLLHHHLLPLPFISLCLFLSLPLHHNHRCSSSSSVYLFILIGIPLHHLHCSHQYSFYVFCLLIHPLFIHLLILKRTFCLSHAFKASKIFTKNPIFHAL